MKSTVLLSKNIQQYPRQHPLVQSFGGSVHLEYAVRLVNDAPAEHILVQACSNRIRRNAKFRQHTFCIVLKLWFNIKTECHGLDAIGDTSWFFKMLFQPFSNLPFSWENYNASEPHRSQ
jgi:hypothetical protein